MSNSITNPSIESLKVHYNKSDFNGSIEILLKNKTTFSKDIFHYNLGTLYAQKNELSIARYHLEKAKSINPAKDITHNLNVINHKLGLEQEIESFDKVDQISFLIKEIEVDYYIISSLVFLMIFFICLITLSRFKKFICIALLFFSVFSCGLGYFFQTRFPTGILLKESPLRSGPSAIYPSTMVIKNGRKVIINKIVDGWCQVIIPRSNEGWLSQNDLGLY